MRAFNWRDCCRNDEHPDYYAKGPVDDPEESEEEDGCTDDDGDDPGFDGILGEG